MKTKKLIKILITVLMLHTIAVSANSDYSIYYQNIEISYEEYKKNIKYEDYKSYMENVNINSKIDKTFEINEIYNRLNNYNLDKTTESRIIR